MKSERVLKDLRQLVRDTEDLLGATAEDLSDRTNEARKRVRRTLERARESCDDLRERAIEGARTADLVVRGHPYQSIGIALGLGLLIGALASVRRAG